MSNFTLYTLIDIVFIDSISKMQYIATPGQCYLYSDNISGLKDAAAGIWLYSGLQTSTGEFYLDDANGAYTTYELAMLKELNKPLGKPGGLRMCYSHTAYEAARKLISGVSTFPIFEQFLGINDFIVLTEGAKTLDYLPFLPKLYTKYTQDVAKKLNISDSDIVEMYDGTNAKNTKAELFIRTNIPILLEPFYNVAKRNKMAVRDCISAWNLAFHCAGRVVGRNLFVGWDPNPIYPTPTHRVSRHEYEQYKTSPQYGFVTPRIKVKSHAYNTDPFKHIDRYRLDIDTAIKSGNALHVKPMTLY